MARRIRRSALLARIGSGWRPLGGCQSVCPRPPRVGRYCIKVAAATTAVPERADASDAGARRWHVEDVVQLCWLGSGHDGVTLAFCICDWNSAPDPQQKTRGHLAMAARRLNAYCLLDDQLEVDAAIFRATVFAVVRCYRMEVAEASRDQTADRKRTRLNSSH